MAFNPALIIEPEDLDDLLGSPGLKIIDLSQAQTHARVHIPGAIHVQPAELVCGLAPATGKLPDTARLNALFSRIGYQPDQHIVVYDDEGGGWAGRFIWTLDLIGHQHHSWLNGGLHAWYGEHHRVDAEAVTVTPTTVALSIDETYRADLNYILQSLENARVKIWDARSPEEYHGIRLASQRGGHIPGAINLDWLETMDRSRNLRLLPLPDLREKLHALGIQEGDEIITHCQTHHRSGLTYLIARALGFSRVKAYDGSWAEWGNLPDTPIDI
ncbi:MAG: rhodanese-like domain-containing protein [Pseudomonadales bacterium]|nr:rhodanese-like domain-containing protein [Pseudomonadales bacterium]